MIGSLRGYARHRGCTLRAVQKAAASGRISLTPDGRVDFEKADVAWAANSRPVNGAARAPRSLVDAQRDLAQAKAELAALQLAKARGELVEAVAVQRDAFACGRRARDRVSLFPSRLEPILLGLLNNPAAIRAALEDEARAIIDDVSESLQGEHGHGSDARHRPKVRRTGKPVDQP